MTLEERYNNAASNTYVGKVRTTQAADYGAKSGVDFMDAGAKPLGTADSIQSNFQRRTSDDVTVVQGGDDTKTYGAGELKGVSRWYGRALNYAFTDPAAIANGITNSQWTTFKAKRVGTKDAWTDNPTFHRWTPKEVFSASTSLSELARTRATGKRPTPSTSRV